MGMELYAAFKHDPEIPAWTTLTVKHVPKPVALIAVGTLCTWLPRHMSKFFRLAGK